MFGMWEESRVPSETHTAAGKTCKLHKDSGPLEVSGNCIKKAKANISAFPSPVGILIHIKQAQSHPVYHLAVKGLTNYILSDPKYKTLENSSKEKLNRCFFAKSIANMCDVRKENATIVSINSSKRHQSETYLFN